MILEIVQIYIYKKIHIFFFNRDVFIYIENGVQRVQRINVMTY